MPAGGYQAPANPAPVSGPGALSQRTDTQPLRAPTGMPYGEHGAMLDSQRAVPLPQPPTPGDLPGSDQVDITQPYGGPRPNFGGPSNRPDEPVTTGVPIGPGAGPEAFTHPALNGQGAPGPTGQPGPMTQMLQKLSASDTTGALAALYQAALARGV